MALADFGGASFADGLCEIHGWYDTTTLRLTTVRWKNLTDRPGSLTIYGPSNFTKVFALAPNTPLTDVDVTANAIQLVQTGPFTNPKTGLVESYLSLPAGWTISINWG